MWIFTEVFVKISRLGMDNNFKDDCYEDGSSQSLSSLLLRVFM